MDCTQTKKWIIVLALYLTPIAQAHVISQWRGPHRDGIYPARQLLKQWPTSGPKMLWSSEGLGKGYGSVALAHDKVYVTVISSLHTVIIAIPSIEHVSLVIISICIITRFNQIPIGSCYSSVLNRRTILFSLAISRHNRCSNSENQCKAT